MNMGDFGTLVLTFGVFNHAPCILYKEHLTELQRSENYQSSDGGGR